MLNLKQKQYAYAQINNWESTGNVAVDMVATAISVERRMQRAPKTIYLNARYYDMFMLWCSFQHKAKKLSDEQMAVIETQGATFDDVVIQKSDILTGAKPLLIEYWPANPNEVN